MQGLLIGISNALTGQGGVIGPGKEIAEAYEIRVVADGGVVESLDCVIDIINNLDAI
jgi:hypothetical protein